MREIFKRNVVAIYKKIYIYLH